MVRARLVVAGATVGALLGGVAIANILASPEFSAWSEAVALAAVSLLFGLGMLGLLDVCAQPQVIGVVAAVWAASSLVALWFQVAQRSGSRLLDVRVGDITLSVENGLPMLVSVGGAVLVLIWSWFALDGRLDGSGYVVAAIAATGLLVTSVTGHAGQSAWAPIVIGVHALVAAWWAGTLGALVLTVRGRGGWARALPAFSERALPAVGILAVTGVVGAVVEIGLSDDWFTAGYGRIVIAKIVLLAAAVAIARWHRTVWLEKARRHGGTEANSIRNAGIELVILAAAFGLAAALAATG